MHSRQCLSMCLAIPDNQRSSAAAWALQFNKRPALASLPKLPTLHSWRWPTLAWLLPVMHSSAAPCCACGFVDGCALLTRILPAIIACRLLKCVLPACHMVGHQHGTQSSSILQFPHRMTMLPARSTTLFPCLHCTTALGSLWACTQEFPFSHPCCCAWLHDHAQLVPSALQRLPV